MKIAIIGYGKMGKVIEEIAQTRGHKIVAKITSEQPNFTPEDLNNPDVAIEFSVPNAAVSNIYKCFSAQIPVVVGTTGWLTELDQVEKQCLAQNGGLFYASNFSIGVNLFFQINEKLAHLMNAHPSYNVTMEEIHHTQKLDSPSGTALTLVDQIIQQVSRKNSWEEASDVPSNVIGINAKRIADTPGTHIVTYENEIDKIEIKHEAKSRKGFALGAVIAAEFMENKHGVYGMKQLLNL